VEILNDLAYLKKYVEEIYKKNDPSHDFGHIMRVYKNAETICKTEKANKKLVLISVLLHDIVKKSQYDKRRESSADLSATKSTRILKKLNFSNSDISIVAEAIRNHSFTKKKISISIEGKILQDADRLDAIGAIGIARVFSVSGAKNRQFYEPSDPFSKNRKIDDSKWALDHFFKKLLLLENMMNTKAAMIEAKKRTRVLKNYLDSLKKEI
jgi:uncharacterized protein|tara:strand:+ start:902 stop:1534 length:633 start_codon:yes stop_codon:yes gene_type:complete